MATKLYVVHGSHPCVTVGEALRMKGIPFKTVELPPPSHALVMRALFGERTVPAIVFEDGEKLQGSRAILARLEQLRPDPPLYGTSPEERARIEEAERWGDDVLQALTRRVLWPALQQRPAAIAEFGQGAKTPPLPTPVVKLAAPLITRIERRMNDATDENWRRDLQDLPGHLDTIDGWIADGVLGGEAPNAADLQIVPSLRLLHTIADLRPLLDGRPSADLRTRWLEPLPATVGAGVYGPDVLPARTAA